MRVDVTGLYCCKYGGNFIASLILQFSTIILSFSTSRYVLKGITSCINVILRGTPNVLRFKRFSSQIRDIKNIGLLILRRKMATEIFIVSFARTFKIFISSRPPPPPPPPMFNIRGPKRLSGPPKNRS